MTGSYSRPGLKEWIIGAALVAGLAFNGWGCAVRPTQMEEWCQDHQCDFDQLAVNPEPALLELTKSAVENIDQQSGAPIVIDPFGIPLHAQPTVFDVNTGKFVCGITQTTSFGDELATVEIFVATEPPEGCADMWSVIRHEIMCHATSGVTAHTEDGVCRINTMSDRRIDQESLMTFCNAIGVCKLQGIPQHDAGNVTDLQ
jgi:hypothetical protein